MSVSTDVTRVDIYGHVKNAGGRKGPKEKGAVMSTQYGTLSYRRTVRVPMWMVVAVIVGTMAIGIAYTVERYEGQGAVATSEIQSFPDTQVAAREGTASVDAAPVFPGGLETSGVIPTVDAPVFPGGLETSGVIPVDPSAQPIEINGSVCYQCR